MKQYLHVGDMDNKNRSYDQIREHYIVEKELAEKLRNASRDERKVLYTHLYDELFQRIPNHPQLIGKQSIKARVDHVALQMKDLRPFLLKETTFLEVGSGDCALACNVARSVKLVYAIDVSTEIVNGLTLPSNIILVISDGCSIPVPPHSINIAYSYQLLEHIHPDDVRDQLHNIYNALAPGGYYICITPNRLNGPHDISKYFDQVATGFHLQEYTVCGLHSMFKEVGFSKVYVLLRIKHLHMLLSPFPIEICEKILGSLPYSVRKSIASRFPFAQLLGIKFVGKK